ncbi:jg7681, partial [Pararge aegeria aegeria]
ARAPASYLPTVLINKKIKSNRCRPIRLHDTTAGRRRRATSQRLLCIDCWCRDDG